MIRMGQDWAARCGSNRSVVGKVKNNLKSSYVPAEDIAMNFLWPFSCCIFQSVSNWRQLVEHFVHTEAIRSEEHLHFASVSKLYTAASSNKLSTRKSVCCKPPMRNDGLYTELVYYQV